LASLSKPRRKALRLPRIARARSEWTTS